MGLFTLPLAGTSALALFAGSGDVAHALPIVFDESALQRASDDNFDPHHLALDHSWKTKRTASDVLTELLDVDGIRVVADRHVWDRPDNLVLRHDFASDTPLHLYCAAGIDRTVYLDSRTSSPASGLAARRRRSVGLMAEAGAAWRLTGQLSVETDIRWLDSSRNARLVRTDAGWVSGDPLGLTLSLVWRGK